MHMYLPPAETVARQVHTDWVARKRAQGVTTRPHATTGEEQLVDWEQLSETVKDDNRALVRTVFEAVARVTWEAPDGD